MSYGFNGKDGHLKDHLGDVPPIEVPDGLRVSFTTQLTSIPGIKVPVRHDMLSGYVTLNPYPGGHTGVMMVADNVDDLHSIQKWTYAFVESKEQRSLSDSIRDRWARFSRDIRGEQRPTGWLAQLVWRFRNSGFDYGQM